MLESIVWYVAVLGSAALFWGIGCYAEHRKEPMWFWAGSQVDSSEITDVENYNRENGRMWKHFSIWFWLAGFAEMLSMALALILLLLSCTVGIAWLIITFNKIDRKYRSQTKPSA